MGEVALAVARWTIKASFFTAVVLAVIVISGIMIAYLVIGFNTSVLADIFALIQIWLPFNLNILLVWLGVIATAYFAYRLSLMAYNMVNAYIGK